MSRLPSIPSILAAGALGASGGFIFSHDVRHASVVAARSGLWSYTFVLLLFAGGLGLVYGLVKHLEEWQALGLFFTGFGCLAYAFAIIATRGVHGWIAFCLILSTGIGHVLRSVDLLRGWR